MIVDLTLAVCVALLTGAVLVGLVGVRTAPDDASRAVVSDLVYFSVVGILAALGVLLGSAVVEDAIMAGALLGVLATVSLARIITRGRR
ncbi:monovalent cation/H+ antiporter complex subunit F [Mobilicoccus pelagius]|uniref:Putative PH adaptation potassium efflux system protein n=1 Tax=Mobilicoccus pelagius NBRC 104925 TaxID=1089455 RepID=H5USQ3_9MICO|nr:monovalent cation/H+ antiporter complex subunit F [Mobilicoccus pelagius]GAB48761.1 putative PH adaptation potassium efflux system protein [Mobilicoccus pelagius NBRC 104925]